MFEPSPQVTLRPASWGDCRRLWEWRNEAGVRKASFQQAPIALEDHERWFAARLADPDSALFVVMVDGQERGYVRFDRDGEDARISVALAPEARGRSYGAAAIAAAVRAFRASRPPRRVVALIRPDNPVSQAVFARAGFVAAGARAVGGTSAVAMVSRPSTSTHRPPDIGTCAGRPSA